MQNGGLQRGGLPQVRKQRRLGQHDALTSLLGEIPKVLVLVAQVGAMLVAVLVVVVTALGLRD